MYHDLRSIGAALQIRDAPRRVPRQPQHHVVHRVQREFSARQRHEEGVDDEGAVRMANLGDGMGRNPPVRCQRRIEYADRDSLIRRCLAQPAHRHQGAIHVFHAAAVEIFLKRARMEGAREGHESNGLVFFQIAAHENFQALEQQSAPRKVRDRHVSLPCPGRIMSHAARREKPADRVDDERRRFVLDRCRAFQGGGVRKRARKVPPEACPSVRRRDQITLEGPSCRCTPRGAQCVCWKVKPDGFGERRTQATTPASGHQGGADVDDEEAERRQARQVYSGESYSHPGILRRRPPDEKNRFRLWI